MERYQWSKLNPMQLGRYAEYLVKMEFTLYAFNVYTAEVDDKGIDFVVRKEHRTSEAEVDYRYYDVQVKAVRGMNYVFFRKDKYSLKDKLLAAVGLFEDGKLPNLYLIPATAWHSPDAHFVDRGYEGLKSKPEWGLNLSHKNLARLADWIPTMARSGVGSSNLGTRVCLTMIHHVSQIISAAMTTIAR
jgi:hypothetical protein